MTHSSLGSWGGGPHETPLSSLPTERFALAYELAGAAGEVTGALAVVIDGESYLTRYAKGERYWAVVRRAVEAAGLLEDRRLPLDTFELRSADRRIIHDGDVVAVRVVYVVRPVLWKDRPENRAG